MSAATSIRNSDGYQLDRAALDAVETVVVHGSCPDGMASAVLLHDALPDARIVFAQHGTDAYQDMRSEPYMLFCDLVPPPERAGEFVRAGAIVLDHHVKVRNVVDKFGHAGRYGDGESGALLAFRYVWDPICGGERENKVRATARHFAELASVRDCWEREDPRWNEACAQASALLFYGQDEWLDLARPFWPSSQPILQERIRVGGISHANKLRGLKRSLDGAYWTRTGRGCRVVMVNGGSISDLAEAIGDKADVVLSFNYDVDDGVPSLKVSARSHGGVDVGAVAVRYGGGGHQKAAGFRLKVVEEERLDPYTLLTRKLVEADL